LNDVPPAAGVGGIGGPLIDHLGGAVGEGSIDDVAVTGNPTDVCRAPVDVGFGMKIKNVLMGEGCLGEVATGGVQDPFGLTGCSGGVQNEQRVFGRKRFRCVLSGRSRHCVMPPAVATLEPFHLIAAPLHDQNVLHGGGTISNRLVDGIFQGKNGTFPVPAIGGNHHGGAGIINSCPKTFGAEPPKNNRMDGA